MSTDSLPVLAERPELPALPSVGPADLYAALLADAKKPTTQRAREQDVNDLARFLKLGSPELATALVLNQGSGTANAVATAWVRDMLDRKLAPTTVNRRVSTLRRLVKLARRFSVVDWVLEVDGQRVETYRDTTGPGRAGWIRMLDVANREARLTDVGKRNLAIVRLLHDHGLRRSEVTSLDLVDWSEDSGRLMVLGKGKTQKLAVTVNPQTVIALSRWVQARGPEPGPLFIRLDRARPEAPTRLDGDSILSITVELGRRAKLGKRARPHGLRHQGVTRILELTNGNIDAAQKFARHSDPKTTQRYNDNRKDVAGEMAKLLGNDA